jgi:hypothetical protein
MNDKNKSKHNSNFAPLIGQCGKLAQWCGAVGPFPNPENVSEPVISRVSRAWHITGLVLALLAYASAGMASQPTPPVSIEIAEEQTGKANSVVAVVIVTANIEVGKAVLSFHTEKDDIKLEADRQELRLSLKKPQTIRVPITIGKAGVHRIDFRVQAEAKGYETAGNVKRRYVVYDGERPPRILTGKEVRRKQRHEMDRKLQERLRKQPDAGLTIDTFLRRPLEPVKGVPAVDDKPQQALVPPASGIEPYESNAVVDKTADVLRKLDPITVTGRLFYTDRGGVLRPLINATVDIRDSDTGPDEQLTSVVTGWDGRYTAVVNNDDGWFQNGRDIYIRVRATNSRFRVQDCAAWPDWTYSWVSEVRDDLSDGTVVNFGDLATNENNEASILFQDLNQGWNFLTTAGAQDPGFVDLCWPEGASAYSTFWEEIDIEDGDEVARDIVLHEYGHATMHNAYNGYWPSNTGGQHGFDDTLHQNMAFTEGWGTFIALSINDDGVYDSNGWRRRIEAFSHVSGHSNGDGQVNEGHVAAGMHDVRDANAEGSCTAGAQCDPSGANAALMSQIWRDSFWRSNSDNIGEYWNRLCSELNSAAGQAAVRALAFNEIDVSPCNCSVSAAMADTPAGAAAVTDLRELRDRGLRNTSLGRRVIEIYYRHTAEVTKLILKDGDLRKMASALFGRAVDAYRVLRKGGEKAEILLDARHAKMAQEFIQEVQKKGSPELTRDFEEVRRLVDQLEGRTFEEIRQKFEQPAKGK